jgi:hypothetical protein
LHQAEEQSLSGSSRKGRPKTSGSVSIGAQQSMPSGDRSSRQFIPPIISDLLHECTLAFFRSVDARNESLIRDGQGPGKSHLLPSQMSTVDESSCIPFAQKLDDIPLLFLIFHINQLKMKFEPLESGRPGTIARLELDEKPTLQA